LSGVLLSCCLESCGQHNISGVVFNILKTQQKYLVLNPTLFTHYQIHYKMYLISEF
jgi:hypothetical protein